MPMLDRAVPAARQKRVIAFVGAKQERFQLVRNVLQAENLVAKVAAACGCATASPHAKLDGGMRDDDFSALMIFDPACGV